MYIIDQSSNRIKKIQPSLFKEAKFTERNNLQEWIVNEPEIFGEKLLYIQKEFNGFDDTQERLDILGIDRKGNLVIIENKLDDTGRDVTWQSIKYASYCSTLNKENIIAIYQKYLGSEYKAEELLLNFLEKKNMEEVDINNSQRIILVAGKYRKEVTSTVLWLRNNYNLDIKCFEVSLNHLDQKYILDIEQIIPAKKEVEEFMISVSNRNKEEIAIKSRASKNIEFWEQFLKISNLENTIFCTISPSKDSWIAKSMGKNIQLCIVQSKTFVRVELYEQNSLKKQNKELLKSLIKHKDFIEKEIGCELIWGDKISIQLNGLNIEKTEDWENMIKFLNDYSKRFYDVFKPIINEIKF
jgi:hypothetical protein